MLRLRSMCMLSVLSVFGVFVSDVIFRNDDVRMREMIKKEFFPPRQGEAAELHIHEYHIFSNELHSIYFSVTCRHCVYLKAVFISRMVYRIAGNVCVELKFALCGFDQDPQTLNTLTYISSAT